MPALPCTAASAMIVRSGKAAPASPPVERGRFYRGQLLVQHGRRRPCYQKWIILPDADAVGRREVESLARLHSEGIVPRVHVANDIGARIRRRMRIGEETLSKVRLPVIP